jgi:hypothetical protein
MTGGETFSKVMPSKVEVSLGLLKLIPCLFEQASGISNDEEYRFVRLALVMMIGVG